jgi:hypothetical protein
LYKNSVIFSIILKNRFIKNKIKTMKHIKTFENYKTNEAMFLFAGLGLLLWYGIKYGYAKIDNLFDFVRFKNAINKIEPIFNKIKDDKGIQSLLQELYENKTDSKIVLKVRDAIYQRAKEILDEKEFDIFVSSAKEFERGSEKKAGYFIDKDSEFQGWKYTV